MASVNFGGKGIRPMPRLLTSRAVTLRATLFTSALSVGLLWNVFFAPQIMTPRPPVFNGADISGTWEWRAMADGAHDWWLWREFPDAKVVNAGYVAPPDGSGIRPVGIQFAFLATEQFGLQVDSSEPPLDITPFDIQDELYQHAKNYSRIDCRDNQAMQEADTCYYFISWDWDLLANSEPVFYGVRTNLVEPGSDSDSEYALVEATLLQSLIDTPLSEIPNLHEVDPG